MVNTTASDTSSDEGFTGLRGALADPDRRLLGTFVNIPRVEVVELVAAAGFDLIVIDAEHGPFGLEPLVPLIAAAQGSGMYAVVRVPELRPHAIGAVLDIGADGILVPHVLSGDATAQVVAAARFAPEGTRSLHNGVRAARYGADPDYFAAANRRTAVLVMCEDIEAVRAIDDLIAVPGADAIFVGPLDLSASMGYVGQPNHPEVVDTVRSVLGQATNAGKAGSLMVSTAQQARDLLDAGARMVLVSVDTAMILEAFTRTRAAVFPEDPVPRRGPGY
ncbi:HpcH/HpaI aldolase family protein [Granulicoccus phenolivorans]|uniref:HpcH/HpaI aldolase family protein n=1 Tax=Granulicoccus phenolivorans TaxID=266854 RepID=UPI000407AB2A|nr:aldolase/citrate lyase family protein [Granulicoccus phenolivorans]